jgi:hypothetical protein
LILVASFWPIFDADLLIILYLAALFRKFLDSFSRSFSAYAGRRGVVTAKAGFKAAAAVERGLASLRR